MTEIVEVNQENTNPEVEPEQIEDQGYKPLFEGESAPSEADLTGSELSETSEAVPETEAPAEIESKNEPAAEVNPQVQMRQNDNLSQIDVLRKEIEQLPEPNEDEFKDFQILTEDEIEDLYDVDPKEGRRYERRLTQYEKVQRQKERRQEALKELEDLEKETVQGSLQRVQGRIPDIFEVQDELADFAIQNGFDPRYLNALTNPATKIIPPGSKDPIILGDGAASLVEMIHALNRKAKSNTPNPPPKPGKEWDKESPSLGIISEADFAKMSAEDQRKALGG